MAAARLASTTASNRLKRSAFHSSPECSVEVSRSATLDFDMSLYATTEAPSLGPTETVTVVSLLAGHIVGGWELTGSILGQILRGPDRVLAMTWLEDIVEYGESATDEEAIEDLVVSLGEYRDFLERRKGRLEESAAIDLNCLRRLIKRSEGSSPRGQR